MEKGKSIKAVEIFSTGTWNNNKITKDVLEDIVKAFNETSASIKPFLKLGHDENQEFLQKDGLPAAGWIEKLYIKGNKLLADFSDIPKKVFQLIESKAYRKVSSEIYSGITLGGKKYNHLLGAVALLGSDLPAVLNLNDIMANYKSYLNTFTKDKDENNNIDIMNISYSLLTNEGTDMPDKTEDQVKVEYDLKLAKEKAEELEKGLTDANEKIKSIEEENAELKQYKLEAEKKIQEEMEKTKKANLDKFISELEKEEIASPSMKPYLTELLSDKAEYKLDEKDITREELVKGLLKLSKEISKVNFKENSEEGTKKPKEIIEDEKIQQYAKENNISYAKAYKAVMKEGE